MFIHYGWDEALLKNGYKGEIFLMELI